MTDIPTAFDLLHLLIAAQKNTFGSNGVCTTDEIIECLSVQPVQVLQYVDELRDMGYTIVASHDTGYHLVDTDFALMPHTIFSHLDTRVIGRKIKYFSTIPSTSWYARELAEQHANSVDGMMIIAREQTGGLGRLGRAWSSPKGGIWATLILKPSLPVDKMFMLTLVGSVSIAKVIRKKYKIGGLIKWPNDIMIGDKKVGGLLVEVNAHKGALDYCLLGFGIDVNVNLDNIDPEIRSRVTSISDELGYVVDPAKLLAACLKEFEIRYDQVEDGEYDSVLREWKGMSATIGRRVRVNKLSSSFEGEAIDVDKDGTLLVRKDNGTVERVIAGDVFPV
ncbi:MAG: biotin--[acetyl-CoA-carboxylase] ligase [Methanomicrobiales archaeon]|jgi:BirA family biotin operon repressor/biotin-[acetyl-CoA-carboxylase] ligase|nr:biotin--[acetyl-CoA-carboxylase] ligase [Methanomicrobiales archaeon]